MKTRMGVVLGSLAIAAVVLTGCAEMAENFIRPTKGPVGQKFTPVLEAIWAQPEIGNGELWKVYVRAHDPNGDLDKVFIGFDQPGGVWSPDFLILPRSQQRNLNGTVLYWTHVRNFSSSIPMRINVRVEDRAGNTSEARTLDIQIVSDGRKDDGNPPAGFKKVVIGQMDFPIRAFSATGGASPGGS